MRKNNSGRNTVADTVIFFVRLLGYGLWVMDYGLWDAVGHWRFITTLPHYHTTILVLVSF
ncbi:MAG TPA: hypothetical protein VGZ71_07440 [Puia sp.]|nr:hypothetical protein [Puia sp.]